MKRELIARFGAAIVWPLVALSPNRRRRWVAQLSGIACILLSSSAKPEEAVHQHPDVAMGQQVFNNTCRLCHTTKQGDNRQGPNLYNIFGRKAGSLPNYQYSSALKGSDFIWDEKTLDRFIANPDEIVPGNIMKPYGGLTSAESRAKIIRFLRSLNVHQ